MARQAIAVSDGHDAPSDPTVMNGKEGRGLEPSGASGELAAVLRSSKDPRSREHDVAQRLLRRVRLALLLSVSFVVMQLQFVSLAYSHHDEPQPAPPMLQRQRQNATKIVAVSDKQYAEVALDWHTSLSSLGYTNHVVVVADDESYVFLRKRGIPVEPLLDTSSSGWPVAAGKPQEVRRRIFATRWVYVLGQLRAGTSVLLTDADNIFVRFSDQLYEMQSSEYDVYHAYCGNFPIRFLSMGFVVCGGMAWLRASDAAIRYVESILDQCHWGGLDEVGGINNSTVASNSTAPMRAAAARCDDQQVINSKFFGNTLNYTWDDEAKKPKVEEFWKPSVTGRSLVTGHRFKIWDVDTWYRGSIDGKDIGGMNIGRCPDPNINWVSMPFNTLVPEGKKLTTIQDRRLRMKQYFEYCGRNTTVGHRESQ